MAAPKSTLAAPILLVLDETGRHSPAMQRAFDFAVRDARPIHIALFAYDALVDRATDVMHPDAAAQARREVLAARNAWVETLAARWRIDGLAVTADVIWSGKLHESVIALALELEPWLVIKDVGHEPKLQRLLYSAPDWKLLRFCPAPLLLVHQDSLHVPRQVLAAVDTSLAVPNSEPLNGRVVRLALECCDSDEIHVAHAFPFPAVGPETGPVMLERVYADIERNDRAAFERFGEREGIPVARRHWMTGSPAREIAQFVRAGGFELVVLGSRYRSTLDRLFVGSTAEALLSEMPCDVLIVKPAEFAEELGRHFHLEAMRRELEREREGAVARMAA